jgi:hypothetical protein
VKYPEETIIFYAVVHNQSSKICLLPEFSYKLFKKYNFNAVTIESTGVYSDYDKLCDDLAREYTAVAKQSIQQGEEGSVLYLVIRDKHEKGFDEVLSLTKLKTLEYRLFRKMREKLRNYLSLKTNATIDQSI